MSASAGRVLIIPKGAYVAGTTYNMLDLVTYNDRTFVAKRTNTNVVPVDGDDWMEIVDNGVESASGKSLALVPTSEGNALATHIYGMSTQDGTPTPSSPVDIVSSKADFRCVGKNINSYPYYQTTRTAGGITWTVNDDGTVTANGTATENSGLVCHSRNITSINKLIIPNGTYILSGCPNGGTNATYYINAVITQNGSAVSLEQDFGEGVEITINGDDNYTDRAQLQIACNIRTNYTASNLTFKPMLTLKGTDQTYEPYKYADFTTDLTLRAIEVTSSDNYNLVRDGKYYISDTVDWSEDGGYVLTRRIGHEALTTANFYQDRSNNLAQFNVPLSMKSKYIAKWVFSNRFVARNETPRANGDCFIDNTQTTNLFVGFVEDSSITSVATATTWLSNNESYVDYALATPITETITSEQVQSLLSLKTYDVSTSINAQASPEPMVELEYAKTQTTAIALSGHNESLIAQELEGLYGAKNLIPYPWNETSKTLNGVTFVDNGDGSVTVSTVAGGASAAVQLVMQTRASDKVHLKAGNYKLSGCPSGGSTTTYMLQASNTALSPQISVIDLGSGADIQMAQGASLGVWINIAKNAVITTPITFKPMLRLATNTSNTYQPYAMSNYELTQKIRELETAIIELGGN